jgi:6-phosphogluconolactonase
MGVEVSSPPERSPRAAGLGAFERFESRQSLAHAVSSRVVDLVGEAFRRKGRAALALAGGRTPLDIYRRLAAWPLRWDWVDITQTGEGWVSRSSLERNANLLRHRLFTDRAAQANFVPFVGAWEDDPGHNALVHSVWRADQAVRALGPLDGVLLGMGPDGHVASIFPNSPANPLLLDPENPSSCLLSPAHPGGPRQPRISLTLGAILRARKVMLVIRGEAKLRMVQSALAAFEPGAPPVAALLHQDRVAVDVLWSP